MCYFWSARVRGTSVSLTRYGNYVPAAADPGNVTGVRPSSFQVAAGQAKLMVAGSRTTVQQ